MCHFLKPTQDSAKKEGVKCENEGIKKKVCLKCKRSLPQRIKNLIQLRMAVFSGSGGYTAVSS